MSLVERGRRRERAGIGLGLGDAGPRLDVGVERDGDGRQDANDRDDDHQLDEGEAPLAPCSESPPMPLLDHSALLEDGSRTRRSTTRARRRILRARGPVLGIAL